MSEDHFKYSLRAQNALRQVVRDVLQDTARNGLPGEHHFYLTFITTAPGVVLSDALKTKHPDEMTIVLQNQYEDLNVLDDHFTVRLSFNHKPETLIIPFEALSRFYDPAVSFGLIFDDFDDFDEEETDHLSAEDSKTISMLDDLRQDMFMLDMNNQNDQENENKSAKPSAKSKEKTSEIVNLDAFRKTRDED
ncbi:MAG: SspB family protein [Parvibaculales bacterium]